MLVQGLEVAFLFTGVEEYTGLLLPADVQVISFFGWAAVQGCEVVIMCPLPGN